MSLLDQRPPFRTVDDESGLQIADELRRHGESSKKLKSCCKHLRRFCSIMDFMTAGTPNNPAGVSLIVETDPSPESIRFLEERLYDFNVRTTGAEGNLTGLFLRTADGSQLGGVYGWSWGGTCYVRYLFVAESMRGRGEGTRLIQAVEKEAKTRNCRQIVLETHDFQAPGFYQKLGFDVVGRVDDYPQGHQYLTLVKHLD